jgi:hypothetical protein
MKDLLFLDDFRTPKLVPQYDYATASKAPFYKEELWDVVCNHDEFVSYIEEYYEHKKKLPELISFDHDLADEHYSDKMFIDADKYNGYYENKFVEKTGYDSAKWLADFCMDNNLELPRFLVHSQNPVGKENIEKFLENFRLFQKKNK